MEVSQLRSFFTLPWYVGVAEEECARVDDVWANDLHLVGPNVPVGHGLVHHHLGRGVLGREVIDVLRCNFDLRMIQKNMGDVP